MISGRRPRKEVKPLEIVFEAGTHEVETKCGKATIVIPHPISIKNLLPALKALATNALQEVDR